MERATILTLALFAASLLFLPKMQGQRLVFPPPRPLCASQFALANYACALLPFSPNPPPIPPSPPAPSPPNDDDDDDDDDDDSVGQGHEEEHGHRHGHGRRHGHRHRHGRRHHVHEATPAEQNCCRWLTQLDKECVCDLLVHLPPFLVRPGHGYTVDVGESCQVTYACGSAIRIKI